MQLLIHLEKNLDDFRDSETKTKIVIRASRSIIKKITYIMDTKQMSTIHKKNRLNATTILQRASLYVAEKFKSV